MNSFSIRDIENLTGIKAHTLRMWEQRYQLRDPKRKISKHRFYDSEDLKFFLRIATLYHQGQKISKIAELSEEEIKLQALELQPRSANEMFVNQLLEATIDMDPDLFSRIFHSVSLHMGFEKCIQQVVYPFLEKVGSLWMTGNVIPSQEHFASNLIRNKIILSIDGLEEKSEENAPIVLLFTLPGEHHELPLLLAHYVFKKNGLRVIYAGVGVELTVLRSIINDKQVTHLFTHLITRLNKPNLEEQFIELSRQQPAIQLILSGPVFTHFSIENKQIKILRSMEEFFHVTDWIKKDH